MKFLWELARRQPDRDRADALPRPGRPSASAARPDARWGAGSAPPGRPASPATSPSARSSSRSCVAAREARGRWTGGWATSCSWAWASRWPTRPSCGRRSSGSTATSACRRAHLTISTVGLVPGIRRLTERPLPVNLAVSLHAANDALRDELVPINQRYPLDDLMAACADYLAVKGRRLSFEWAMIDGVNDRASRRRRARQAVPPVPPAGPRQPDPAQPDARLPDRRFTAEAGPRVPRPARVARASTPRCAATAAPTSTPPAASSPPVSP